jgi:hypothetical protein
MIQLVKKLILAALLLLSLPSWAETLPIPDNLIAYNSETGKELLGRSLNKEYLQLSAQFLTQKTQTYCSVASISLVLNSLNVKGPDDPIYSPFHPITQDNFFTPDVTKVIDPKEVALHGMTLDQAALVTAQFQVTTQAIHSDQLTLDKMRQLLSTALEHGQQYVIVNFYRPGLKEQGAGHFSPIAAYDAMSDRFLILDVARYKYPPIWVKASDLWNAINTLDTDSQKMRGVLIVNT